mgnify:FL=1
MKKLEEIIKPYKDQLLKIGYKSVDNGNLNPDVYLFQKWHHKVEKNWYGFSLGNVPFVWALIIDRFLEELEKGCPDFKIHQIKLKMGGLRFYVSLSNDDSKIPKEEYIIINEEIHNLEDLLFDQALIY